MRRVMQAFALLLVSWNVGWAHEKGAIHLSRKLTQVHSTISVSGERLSKNAAFRLELRGTLATFNLGSVKSDAKGTFTGDFTLPPEAGAANYAVVLVATDGDISARADLTLMPVPAATAVQHATHETMPGMTMSPPTKASAEMMALSAATNGAEWAAIVGFSALTLAAGLGLLSRRRA